MALSSLDIAWAAGFYEGEGCIGFYGNTLMLRVGQVQKEPLERLQRMFGGSIYLQQRKDPNHKPIWRWTLSTRKAAQAAMTLLALLSPRRTKQVKEALTIWKKAPTPESPRPGGQKTLCVNGHEFSERPRFDYKGHKVCFICKDARRVKHSIHQKEGDL